MLITKEKRKQYNSTHYYRHRAELLEQKRNDYVARRKEIKERRKEYRKGPEVKKRMREAGRRYHLAHRESVLERKRQAHLARRLRILSRYGAKCACCGEDNYKFLAIDHINGGGRKHRKEIGVGGYVLVRWLEKNNYPEGFQVLCHNCNAAKAHYGSCPHSMDRR